MQQVKRYLGIVWMLFGPATIILLLIAAITNINSDAKGDIHEPLPWIIIIGVFTPVAIGLMIFGWYAWKQEYTDLEANDVQPKTES